MPNTYIRNSNLKWNLLHSLSLAHVLVWSCSLSVVSQSITSRASCLYLNQQIELTSAAATLPFSMLHRIAIASWLSSLSKCTMFRATTVDFWQARPPQRWPQWRPYRWATATAVAVFYSAKFRQGRGLAGLTPYGGPVVRPRLELFTLYSTLRLCS